MEGFIRGVIMKVYNKLVRDKIPEIIEADGKVCRTHILSNEEYIVALEAMRAKKANERGGFKEKIFLEHVEEKR